MKTFTYCGYRLASDIELAPFAVPCASSGPVDIRIEWAGPPAALEGPITARGALWRWNGQALLWRLEDIASFRVAPDGGRIEVDTHADPASAAVFLLRVILPIAALLRGDCLLEGSAVARDGQAVAFIGPSASGKSTVAAVLAGQGWTWVADSLLRISRGPDGRYLAYPQGPGVWLWPDAAGALALADGTELRPGLPLRQFPCALEAGPVPISRIGRLRQQRGNDLDLFEQAPRQGMRVFEWLLQHQAASQLLKGVADRATSFHWAVGVGRQAPCALLEVPWGWDQLPALARELTAWAQPSE